MELDPHGEVARDLDEALTVAESPGVTATLRRTLERARLTDKERLGQDFARLVRSTGLTRSAVARHLGTSRSRLSTYETGTTTPSAVIWRRLEELARPRPVHHP
ncbi:helix-turn-helix domain-containing protein [Litorihabitans aurantiacus]|uniref:helix-turn-helix domain-containing protein n=1 Tax=Litorihabitans aurantiacus TaxID=1930061 RepID=UPI0024E18755|nr:helix-turn-helix transcriptional regulator [Litorihabitans aurantiacus]